MVRADRFARLFWFIVIIALSGLTLLTMLAWLGEMISALIGLIALTVCVGAWGLVARVLRRPDLGLTVPARQQLVTTTVMIGGQPMPLAHSQLDIGQPQDMFDGDTFTLARGAGVNPLVVEFVFDSPREIVGLHAVLGRMDFAVRVQLYSATDPKPHEYSGVYQGLPGEPSIALDFRGTPKDVTKLRLEIEQLNPPEDVHIHVREISIKFRTPAS